MNPAAAMVVVMFLTPGNYVRRFQGFRSQLPSQLQRAESWHLCRDSGIAVNVGHPGDGPRFSVCVTQSGASLSHSQALNISLDAMRREGCTPDPMGKIEWSPSDEKLSVSRDPMGQVSLFYYIDDCHIVISDRLDVLLYYRRTSICLDSGSAFNYLLYGRPLLGRTLARGVFKVPAGHRLEVGPKTPLLMQRYYTPLSYSAKKVLDTEDKIALLESFDQTLAVRASERSQAILLSGGVDSSFVASSIKAASPMQSLEAYTVRFSAPYDQNEVEYAQFVADSLDVPLHVVDMAPEDAYTHFREVLAQPEPTSAWASLTHLHLLQRLKFDGFSHFFSGLGADETFGGYSRYLSYYRKFRFAEAKWESAGETDPLERIIESPKHALNLLFPGVAEFFSLRTLRKAFAGTQFGFSPYAELASFYQECRFIKPSATIFELMVAHECQHRIPDLLFSSFEALGQQHGVVGRYPFLVPKLVRVACGLSAAERFWIREGRWQNKRLLKEVASARVPERILHRPIGSYDTPIALWLNHKELRQDFRCLLNEGRVWNKFPISREWRDQIDGVLFGAHGTPNRKVARESISQGWAMITLAAWFETWIGKTVLDSQP